MNKRAVCAISTGARALSGIYLLLALLGCSGLPSAAPASTVYDFGPGVVQQAPTNRMAPLPTLALGEVVAPTALDHLPVQYRLGYSDAQQLRPYSQARWSMPPAQLLRQRVREILGARRSVVNQADGLVLSPDTLALRLELEEFSQLFEQPGSSDGVVRLRATLSQAAPKGEALVAQRSVLVRRPAASADAAGGVRALTAAVDAAVQELDAWVQQVQQAQAAPR
ncbi:MAG: ABC-type transport auxiliary lipoprotein family protein [Rhodoferax sp.]|nr:ABC-type transport auxiliary lipoprotein family protein [Rhodoferax sp.]